ncbi:hypothetical protein CVT24_008422 [Panaeolus cyanescens]|uniref:histidine kinase n=1 Tax=Panaeolus cyanescens TaxID=181874 RepID=A0A409VBI5_9AGAR|nr:hypothetical protein CVT24_008422 [Panaeolus cyanescens]
MPSASTSTAVDTSLPPPVLHKVESRKMKQKSARFAGLNINWANFRRRIGTGTAPSSGSLMGESTTETTCMRKREYRVEDGDHVDTVVVDRVWTEEIKTSVTHSDHGGTPEKSGGSNPPLMGTDNVSDTDAHGESYPRNIFQWQRGWKLIMKLFSSRFADEASEEHYAQETWFYKKSLAFWASLWLIANWVLGCIFIPHNPIAFQDKIFYFAIAPVLSLPVVFMIMYDWPRDRPYIYQIFLTVSIWCWSFYQVIFIITCGYYSKVPKCGDRDFLATFYYNTVLAFIPLVLNVPYSSHASFGTGGFDVLPVCIYLYHTRPQDVGAKSVHSLCFLESPKLKPIQTFPAGMINFFIFQSFLIYVHYVRERAERRLYVLRDQLKVQYKATQKAQINERKVMDSKRRLTSYVFHDMYNPFIRFCRGLPACFFTVLAVQNMEASRTIAKEQEVEFNALCGSLSMMSKVLNDVLDFNRMDSGRFESASRPYAFHQVMQSLFVPLRLTTDARGLKLETDLDPNIDLVARKAAYEAMGESMESIRAHILEHPDVDGVVTGDENRLRQIITNLASNACKFTPSGGKLSVRTRLVLPAIPAGKDVLDLDAKTDLAFDLGQESRQRPLSADYLAQHNLQDKPKSPLEWIVVRIEVTDTGYGIKPQDMAEAKLFSAFNQTEQGIQQGGKGTGLGLALVRQIVKLSGGRLGVQSKPGEGSTFWVELPLGVGARTFVSGPPDLPDGLTPSDLDTLYNRVHRRFNPPDCDGRGESSRPRSGSKLATKIPNSTALQCIMEQGGRVELVLKHDYGTPAQTPSKVIDDPLTGVMISAEVEARPMTAPGSTDGHEVLAQPAAASDGPPDVNQGDENKVATPPRSLSPETSKPPLTQRPTFVQLPSPQKFAIDGTELPVPESTSSHSQQSRSSSDKSSNLTNFDSSFALGGTPRASVIGFIEPNLPVLVVDDDPLTRMLMKRTLSRLGCKVWCAENGEVALEMILGQRPWTTEQNNTPSSDVSRNSKPILEQQSVQSSDPGTPNVEGKRFGVVFLDNQMPIMSGLAVVSRLRELKRSDFIVGVTGNALLSDQAEYLEAGVDQVLTKPVLERSLRDVLVQASERRKNPPLSETNNSDPGPPP